MLLALLLLAPSRVLAAERQEHSLTDVPTWSDKTTNRTGSPVTASSAAAVTTGSAVATPAVGASSSTVTNPTSPATATSSVPGTNSAAPGSAGTDSAATTALTRELSSYEQESLDIALQKTHSVREPSPEGKTIEGIDIVSLEVLEERDGLPLLFLNAFHTTTKRNVIEREVLLKPGQLYDQALVDESERILRNYIQISVVLAVPTKASSPDKVRLLIVAKDVWSLRVSWAPSFYNGKLVGLALQPAEWNLAGTAHRASASLNFTPLEYWVGLGYTAPRIGDGRMDGYASANVSLDCETHKPKGATGNFGYGQPLYSSQSEWSWYTAMQWTDVLQRPASALGAAICSSPRTRSYTSFARYLEPRAGDHLAVRSVEVPYRYREERLRGQLLFTRSYYRTNKLNLSFGLEADERAFRADAPEPGEVFGRISTLESKGGASVDCAKTPNLCFRSTSAPFAINDNEAAAASYEFQTRGLPPRDERISPYFQIHAYRSLYQRLINYDTLGLQEDVQLGHNVYLRLYPAFRPLSSRSLLGVFSSATYTWQLADGFAKVLGAGLVELAQTGNENGPVYDAANNPHEVQGLAQSDAQVQLEAHFASPDLGAGRFVSNVELLSRPIRYLNRLPYVLGGTDQLRGYAAGAFFGTNRFAANTEFRTRPLRVLSVLAGLNAFWDAGDASYDWKFQLKHGVGVGVRFLFPQLDREVFRVDVAIPIKPHEKGELTWFAGFTRVFGLPSAPPPALLIQ